jgi:hypothetical protein
MFGELEGSQEIWLIAAFLTAVCVALGDYRIAAGLVSLWQARRSQAWPVAAGTVLHSEVHRMHAHGRKHRTASHYIPRIAYRYRVQGKDYESGTVRFGNLARYSRSLADALVARYPEGAMVGVRYDPADPGRATLETASAGWRQILLGLAFIAAPILFLLIAFVDLSTPIPAWQLG